MTADKIISVNPSKATLGSLHPEITAKYLRQKSCVATHKRDSKGLKRFLAGYVTRKLSAKFGLVRLVSMAMILLVSLSSSLSAVDIPASVMMPLGIMIGIGFFTVPAAVVLGVLSFFGILTGFSHDVTPICSMMTMLISMMIVIIGPGRYSCDFLMYSALRKRRVSKMQSERETPISYKAYRNLYHSL